MGRAARRRLLAIVGILCLSSPVGPARAADAPGVTSAPADTGKPVSLAPQIAALRKEWQAYATGPRGTTIRSKSDYFKGKPVPGLTPEVVLKALEGGVGGGPAAEAYVKWQLLSAVPGKFPAELLQRAVAVYRRAPAPGSHPGFNRHAMDRAINGMKKADAAGLQAELSDAVERLHAYNQVFLDYRDELFARLPGKLPAYEAGLEDAADRAWRGLNAGGIFDNVSAGLRSWAITDGTPGQVAAVVNGLRRLRAAVTAPDARPYAKIGDNKGMAKWEVGNYAIDPKKIDQLMQFLANNASGMGGGLKFKDSDEK